MSKRGQWKQMAPSSRRGRAQFTATAPHREPQAAVEKRFGGLVDSIAARVSPTKCRPASARELLDDLRTIPHAFQGFPQSWA